MGSRNKFGNNFDFDDPSALTAVPNEEQSPKKKEPAPAKDNPLAGMIDKKQNGKACGFYLSEEAVSKLEKLAKQNKCSKSKALDTLLRNLI